MDGGIETARLVSLVYAVFHVLWRRGGWTMIGCY